MTTFQHVIAAYVADLYEFTINKFERVIFVLKILEYIRSLMFKYEFVGEDAIVPSELRIYYTLFDVYLVRAFMMEVSMSISGFCIYASVYIGAVKRY